jgi:gliding motility-associated-like protein
LHDTVFTNYITTYQLPVAGFTPKPETVSFFTPTIDFINKSTADVVLWDWDLGDGAISADPSPVHDYVDTGRFFVRQIVTNDNGCLDTAYGKVFIWPDYTFYIPTAFTPDAGDLNPTFGPDGIFKGIIEFEMKIYSRWGELLFTSNKLANRWDGSYRDEKVAEGVYVYEITIMDYFKNKRHFKGSLLLIR